MTDRNTILKLHNFHLQINAACMYMELDNSKKFSDYTYIDQYIFIFLFHDWILSTVV
jgi:hypothetical protein